MNLHFLVVVSHSKSQEGLYIYSKDICGPKKILFGITLNIIHNNISQSVVMHNSIIPSPCWEANWNELGICVLYLRDKKITVNAVSDFPLGFILQISFSRFSSICLFTKVNFLFVSAPKLSCFAFSSS